MHIHFQVQALFISRKNIVEQQALIPGGDQQLFIQDNLLSCRLVLLSSMYMGNCHCFSQYLAFAGSLHKIFEGHMKGGVTSKVLDPPFVNLVQRSDSSEEPMLIR